MPEVDPSAMDYIRWLSTEVGASQKCLSV
jgi:hypothetical protein